MEQKVFDFFNLEAKNWFACPKENGIKNEIALNYERLQKISHQKIGESILLCQRQIQLYKELERTREHD